MRNNSIAKTAFTAATTLATSAALVLCFAGCSGSAGSSQAGNANGGEATQASTSTGDGATVTALPYTLDTAEYALYQNVFYNNAAADYVDKPVTKTGCFSVVQDCYNNTTRYYVWGYNDETKCCDWQWELSPTDTSNLPSVGSKVKVSGTLVASDKALDGYWIKDAQITVDTAYNGPAVDVNMSTMSATLEKVQLLNIQYKPKEFEGESVILFGRVESPTSIVHPYYDDVWNETISTTGDVPATGTVVLVQGTISNGEISDAQVSETDLY